MDFNNALQYYEGLDDTNNNIFIEALKVKLSWFNDNRKRPFDAFEFRTLRTEPFNYKLRVIEVIDSIAITKVYSKQQFVKIRKGDVVSIY